MRVGSVGTEYKRTGCIPNKESSQTFCDVSKVMTIVNKRWKFVNGRTKILIPTTSHIVYIYIYMLVKLLQSVTFMLCMVILYIIIHMFLYSFCFKAQDVTNKNSSNSQLHNMTPTRRNVNRLQRWKSDQKTNDYLLTVLQEYNNTDVHHATEQTLNSCNNSRKKIGTAHQFNSHFKHILDCMH